MVFRIRIVVVDYYLSKPVANFDPLYSVFRASDIRQVPIIRIFGTSDQGHKCCLHVHGFFPYFSIRAQDVESSFSVQTFCHELDRQINLKLGRPGQTHHVYLVEKILSTNFYGFHSQPQTFYRVHFYSEQARKNAVSILRSGTFWHRMFDVFEAHFNYITQFFVSFNLFGMNFVCLDKVWPREGVDLQAIGDHYAGIHFPRQRQTNCDLEMDCIGSCITNTRESAGDLNPGLRLIWNEEIERRVQKVQSVEELFKDIIDDSVRTSKRNQLEKDYISSLRAFLFRSNSQELSQTLISKAYYSMSQTWQIQNSNRLNSEQPNADKQNHLSQVLLRSFEDPHSICTQEVIDLIKCSQNLLVDEELMQHLLDDESEPEDVEENQNEENDEEKLETTKSQNRVSQLRLEHRKKSQPYEEIPINDSIMINSNGYNLNSESIIRTPGLSSVPFSFTAPEESAIYSDDVPLPNHSCASNEIDLFDDDERPGSKCASSPVLNDELDSDLIRTNAVDLELNLFDSSEVTLLECQSPALRSSPTSLFASSDKRCGSAAIESPSLFSFYLSESQPDSSLPTGTPTIGVKRRRLLSAPTTMQNSTTRCSTPFGDPLRSSSQNHEFVHQIRHLMQNSSEEKTANHEYQNLTIMSMELFALTDNPIKPDPNLDSIKIIFFQIYWDRPATASNCGKNDLTGVILCESDVDQLDLTFNPSTAAASACGHKKNLLESCGIDCSDLKVRSVTTELQLIESLLETVHCYDPEVLIGFEIETSSWGYLIARAGQLGIDCAKAFSRLSSTALIEEEMQFEKRWQRLQTVHPQPNQSTASSTSSSFLRSDAGIKSNNYLRRPVDSNLVEKPQKVWQKIDEFKRNLENGGESQAPASQNDGQLERDIENFFSLSYVSPCYMNFTGRIMLNLWRLMRKEVALTSYTYESLCLHVLARRVPHYSSRQLNQWFTSADSRNRWRVIDYFLSRARTNIELINKADVIGRNSELARVFGIQFSDVISKGTQFRVESLLYRSAIKQNDSFEPSEHDRAQNFMLLSCDFKKRARQHDPFMIPFVMDPIVGFYTDPVAVLDFQSLYPSIMIAHNYCYSTCVGRLESLLDPSVDFFGCSSLRIDADFVRNHFNDITVSPNGLVFVKKHIRKGVLCGILEELLNSRIMVKNSIKKYAKQQPQDERLLRLLDARQLGLKLISNVTYGYTAAGFSGRMPCVDLADAIISKGRETLMEAMRLVHECQVELGGQVVYGDTDSIFICFQGCSVEEAFKRAAVLCDRITTSNPKPVKIKLEKIYSRSVLMTKKRYAGYCWESANDPHPQLECKGIETVRRDSIPLVKRVLDKGLRILFTSPETDRELLLNQLRSYFEHEFVQVLKNHRQRLHEFVFAREYRGQFGYRTGQLLPSIVIANHLVRKYGENCRPFSKQRVPYVICLGEHEKEPLAKLARLPLDFLHSNQMQLNCKYYIESVLIPPLQRVFGYLDVSISSWYQQLPSKARLQSGANIDCRVGRLTDYVQMKECTICAANIPPNSSIYSDIGTNPFPLCDGCLKKPQSCALHLVEYLREVECRFRRSSQICTLCQSVSDSPADCEALNCHNLFELQAARALMSKHSAHSDQLNEIAVHFYQSLQIYTKS